MSDRILVSRLALYAYHGVLEEEAALGQRFFVSLEARLDLSQAGRADDHALSVNYADLAALAHRIGTTRRFRTMEGLAEAIAADILLAFPRIESIVVRAEKPSAPVPLPLDTVVVEIERRRPDISP